MQLTVNSFKRRLATGELQRGLFCGLRDTVAAEISAGAGFDWMMFDAEHAPIDAAALLPILQAVAAYSVPIVVRPPEGDNVRIKQLLDLGVQTLLVPMVESADQARAVVAAVRYPPRGVRGVGPSMARAARWNRTENYLHDADDEMCVIAQIESVAGLAAVEEIAAVEGIDALFVGPSDLAASMGHLGNPSHPEVVAAVDDAIRRSVAAGKPAGAFAVSAGSAVVATASGAAFLAVGSDLSLLAAATAQLATAAETDRPE